MRVLYTLQTAISACTERAAGRAVGCCRVAVAADHVHCCLQLLLCVIAGCTVLGLEALRLRCCVDAWTVPSGQRVQQGAAAREMHCHSAGLSTALRCTTAWCCADGGSTTLVQWCSRFVHLAVGCWSVCARHVDSVLCCVVTCRCSSRWAFAMLPRLPKVRLCRVAVHAALGGA
jgi:hypothetical protein